MSTFTVHYALSPYVSLLAFRYSYVYVHKDVHFNADIEYPFTYVYTICLFIL